MVSYGLGKPVTTALVTATTPSDNDIAKHLRNMRTCSVLL